MYRFFQDCTGALAPIEATDDMTRPVGQRNGQLFVQPGDTLPDPTEHEEHDTIVVENGQWVVSGELYRTLQENTNEVNQATTDIAQLNSRLSSILASLQNELNELSSITGLSEETIDEYLESLSRAKTLIRDAANLFGSGILTNDSFGATEEGGVWTSVYANKIRAAYTTILSAITTILGEEITPLLTALSVIENAKNGIKDQVNILRPDTITAEDKFSSYPNLVRLLAQVQMRLTSLTNNAWSNGYMNEFTIPIEDVVTGDIATASLQIPRTDFTRFIYQAKKLIIPDHYTTWGEKYQGPEGITSVDNDYACEEIQWNGEAQWGGMPSTGYYIGCLGKLRILNMPDVTDTSGNTFPLFVRGGSETEPIILNIPKVKKITRCVLGQTANAGTTGIPVECHFDSLISLSSTAVITYEGFGESTTGTIYFPVLTTLNNHINNVNYPLTLYMPSITSMGSGTTSGHLFRAVSNSLNLYIGPNLATMNHADANSVAEKIKAGITAGYITVHIPAGESTTKTLLDSYGITYTQDYVIE